MKFKYLYYNKYIKKCLDLETEIKRLWLSKTLWLIRLKKLKLTINKANNSNLNLKNRKLMRMLPTLRIIT